MTGAILLAGGAEFGGQMRLPDQQAIERAGGLVVPIRILPTAAAPDHNHERAGRNGERWFRSLGARDVAVLPVIDRASADDARQARELEAARLIYLLGGFTHYLGQTLAESACANAMWAAYRNGAVIAGSSAGAMVLCEHYYDPDGRLIHRGLNVVPNACVLPHHNTFGRHWAPRLSQALPSAWLLGIDEETGMLSLDEAGSWRVFGRGGVTLYRQGKAQTFPPEAAFRLDASS